MKIELGQKVKDIYTGVTGYTTAVTVYLQGCRRFLVETGKQTKDGTLLEYWFDEERLQKLPAKKKQLKKKPTGGPAPIASSRSVSKR